MVHNVAGSTSVLNVVLRLSIGMVAISRAPDHQPRAPIHADGHWLSAPFDVEHGVSSPSVSSSHSFNISSKAWIVVDPAEYAGKKGGGHP